MADVDGKVMFLVHGKAGGGQSRRGRKLGWVCDRHIKRGMGPGLEFNRGGILG